MRRVLLAFLTLMALGWMAGCSNSGSSIGTNNPPPSPAPLHGQYAFVLSGYDETTIASPKPLAMAGTITADGAGHITAGSIDINDGTTISTNAALTGTYAFDVNGFGTLGIITLTNTVGGIPLKFGFALKTDGTSGNIMGLDTTNSVTTGTMELQTPSTFSFAGIANNYAVLMTGQNASNPTSALGSFTLGTTGTVSNVSFDRSISGMGTAGPTVGPSAAVAFSSAPNATTGRGSMTVTLNDGLLGAGTQTFMYYTINASRFVAVEADANGIMTINAASQAAPATVNTAGSAFGMSGFDSVALNDIAAVGQIIITNGITASATWDSNDAGIFMNPTLAGTVAYNSATGRGTISIATGTSNGLADTLVFYLDATGTGFIMDATAGITNRGMAGPITAQTGVSSFSAANDLAGLALIRVKGVSPNNAETIIGDFGADTTTTYSFLFDQRLASTSTVQTAPLDSLTGSFSLVTAINTGSGRGELVISGTETLVFYVIAPNQFVMIDVTPKVPATGQTASGLFIASPEQN